MGKVQQQFCLDSSRPEPIVDLWLPEGPTVQQSEIIAERFDARLMQEPGVFRHIKAEPRQPGHRAAQEFETARVATVLTISALPATCTAWFRVERKRQDKAA